MLQGVQSTVIYVEILMKTSLGLYQFIAGNQNIMGLLFEMLRERGEGLPARANISIEADLANRL